MQKRAAIAIIAACNLSGCISTSINSNVPECERVIPPSLLAETPPADIPIARQLPDGHDDAQPWQVGFVEQTGQLQIANTKAPAVDHIYRECLALHRAAIKRARPKFLGIF